MGTETSSKKRDGTVKMYSEIMESVRTKHMELERKEKKKKKDRLRYLVKKDAMGALSEAENIEMKQLQSAKK